MVDRLSGQPQGGSLSCRCNFFQMSPQVDIHRYKVDIQPILPENKMRAFHQVMRSLKSKIEEKLKPSIVVNFTIYSPTPLEEPLIFEDVEFENGKYTVTIEEGGFLDDENAKMEKLNFLGRIFKICQKSLKLQEIQRKHFNPAKAVEYREHKLDIWPGFASSVGLYHGKVLVNIDMSYKILRKQTCLEYLNDLRRQNLSPDKISDEMVGSVIMTCYNKKMYRIDDINYDIRLTDTFQKRDEAVTYIDYYQSQYKITIKDPRQPMLRHVDKRTNREIYLVPELCYMTGLTDQMRNDFRLMKDIAKTTKCDAAKRLADTQSLIQDLNNPSNARSYDLLKDWKIQISDDPLQIGASKLGAGKMVMGNPNGNRIEIPFENTPDFDRKTQCEMFNQPPLNAWGIMCPDRDRETCESFFNTMEQCVKTFNYPMRPPKIIYVDTRERGFGPWKKQIEQIPSQIQAIVFLLSGPKKGGFNYAEIKNEMIQSKGIPSQCALVNTLKGKGLRSICNKILVQICAKVGGIPWSISDMPFTEQPTMLVGVDTYQKQQGKKRRSIMAMVATMNKTFSKYWSTCRPQQSGQDMGTDLASGMKNALEEFKKTCGIFPTSIIVFRDGVSESQRKGLEEIEVTSFRKAMTTLGVNIKMVYICINKRVGAKFYVGDNLMRNNLSSPNPGTLINHSVTEGNGKDFYLISQKTTQGIATPSHYHLLVNDFEVEGDDEANKKTMEKIQLLCYKQCYMYYNWTGSIKIPAPVQYAHKLSNLVGDKFTESFKPHTVLGENKSLYFI